MKEIKFNYLRDWKVTKKFMELYHKQVSIVGRLDKNFIREDDIEIIIKREKRGAIDDYDKYYISLVNANKPENYLSIYMGGTLRNLLKKGGYKGDYNGLIRVYGEFGGINTTRTNIGKIWRVDILDEKGNIIEVFENKKLKPNEM